MEIAYYFPNIQRVFKFTVMDSYITLMVLHNSGNDAPNEVA